MGGLRNCSTLPEITFCIDTPPYNPSPSMAGRGGIPSPSPSLGTAPLGSPREPPKLKIVPFCVYSFFCERGPPKEEVDMQSVHASAGFVRVGRSSIGSILDSMLESFWEPSWPLYSFGVALGAKKGNKSSIKRNGTQTN